MAWVDLDVLLQGVSIIDVARRLGKEPRKDGDLYRIICPFHSDTRPSLALYPDTGPQKSHFHCFACGEHGDIISLVKEIRGSDFQGAVEWLASTYSKQLNSNKTKLKKTFTEKKLTAGEEAYKLYQQYNSLDELDSWAQARGFKSEVLQNIGITYAKTNSLTRAISELPYSEARILAEELHDNHYLRRLQPTNTARDVHDIYIFLLRHSMQMYFVRSEF